MLAPSLSCVIERGPSPESRTTTRRRVGSPSAANTGAALARRASSDLCMRDMALDVERLRGPASLVHLECLRATLDRDLFETRLSDGEQCTALGVLQSKFDKGHRFGRVIQVRIDRIRMPA